MFITICAVYQSLLLFLTSGTVSKKTVSLPPTPPVTVTVATVAQQA